MFYQDVRDPEHEAADRDSAAYLLAKLDDEARDIITLWTIEDLSFDEIGVIVGNRYYGEPMPGTKVRYRKDKAMATLRGLREEVGL